MTTTTTGVLREGGSVQTGGFAVGADQVPQRTEGLSIAAGKAAGDSVPARSEGVSIGDGLTGSDVVPARSESVIITNV